MRGLGNEDCSVMAVKNEWYFAISTIAVTVSCEVGGVHRCMVSSYSCACQNKRRFFSSIFKVISTRLQAATRTASCDWSNARTARHPPS